MSTEHVERQVSDERALQQNPKRPEAVAFLRNWMEDANTIDRVRAAIQKDRDKWWAVAHFGWGMQVRNALRAAGFGESDLGIQNLDNVYVRLLVEACDEGDGLDES